MSISVTARIQQTPPDDRGGHDLAVDAITATGDDYESARSALTPQIPAGWRVVAWMVDRQKR